MFDIRNLFRRRKETRDISTDMSGQYTGSFTLPTLAGSVVNEHTALSISAVWNAVNIYANTIASLNLYVAERDIRGGHRPAFEHPVYDLVHSQPNPRSTSFRFRQSIVGHALTFGNGYAEIVPGKEGPKSLHLMDPRNVEPRIHKDTGDLTYHLVREHQDLPASRVLHIAGLSFDGINGYSPITMAREALGLSMSLEKYQAALMGNSAVPTGYIEYPGKLKEEAVNRLRDNFNKTHQGSDRAGNFAILDNGFRWVQTSFSPADAELILSRGFSIAEVARLFNLPQHMLGLLEHATFSNIEEQNIQFYQLSLMPWLESIEQELCAKLLSPSDRRSFFVRHDVSSLLRGNLAAQTARQTALFGIGVLSINEIRLENGQNPIDHENGDKHFVPTNNLTAVEDLGIAEDPDIETEDPTTVNTPDETPEPLPVGTLDALRDVLSDALSRAIRRENVAITKASKRTGFTDWLDEWLPEHAAYLTESLSPALRALGTIQGKAIDPRTFAETLCDGSRDVLRTIAAQTPAEELPGAIERQASDWAARRADSILHTLFNKQ